ncbi:MAG: hypothetical protein ACRYFU_18080 [Janthinobacterium lividum]
MRLHPRHYLLIAVLVALGMYNFIRLRHRQSAGSDTAIHVSGSPAWQAYDRAAALRDAANAQFTPALENLRPQASAATGPDAGDLRNCLMWLEYYRHSVPMASGKPGDWAMLSTSHVQSCMTEHRDLGR